MTRSAVLTSLILVVGLCDVDRTSFSAFVKGSVGQNNRASIQKEISVDLPLTETGWVSAIMRLAARDRRLFGLELAPGAPKPRHPEAGDTRLVLTDVGLDEALSLLVDHDARYSVQRAGDVIAIRPTASINNRDDFLNRRIPDFELTDATLFDAIDAINHTLDRGYRQHARHESFPTQFSQNRTNQIRDAIATPIRLRLVNMTVREVLNAIALANGSDLPPRPATRVVRGPRVS